MQDGPPWIADDALGDNADPHEADVEDDFEHHTLNATPAPLHVLSELVANANSLDVSADRVAGDNAGGLTAAETGDAAGDVHDSSGDEDVEDDGGDDSDDGEHYDDDHYVDAEHDADHSHFGAEASEDLVEHEHDGDHSTDHFTESDHPFSPIHPHEHDSSDHADEKSGIPLSSLPPPSLPLTDFQAPSRARRPQNALPRHIGNGIAPARGSLARPVARPANQAVTRITVA